MPIPTPPSRGPMSALAALSAAYPLWQIWQADDGSWIAVRGPVDASDAELLSGRYTAIRADTLPALAAGVRSLHAERWQAAS